MEYFATKDDGKTIFQAVKVSNISFFNLSNIQMEQLFPKELCNINEVYGLTVKTFCHRDSVTISCSSNILPGTVATVSCKQGYKTAIHENPSKEYLCLDSGKWDDVVFRCQPQCGLLPSTATKLIYGGEDTNITNVPWMAGE